MASTSRQKITVLFGGNGAGKSTVLEAISWLFQDAPSRETLPRSRPGGAELPHSYPGYAILKLDQWRDDRSLEQQVLWRLLTDPRTHELLFWFDDDLAPGSG